jgi:hypothetical protein
MDILLEKLDYRFDKLERKFGSLVNLSNIKFEMLNQKFKVEIDQFNQKFEAKINKLDQKLESKIEVNRFEAKAQFADVDTEIIQSKYSSLIWTIVTLVTIFSVAVVILKNH